MLLDNLVSQMLLHRKSGSHNAFEVRKELAVVTGVHREVFSVPTVIERTVENTIDHKITIVQQFHRTMGKHVAIWVQ